MTTGNALRVRPAPSAMAVYDAALRRAERGVRATLDMIDDRGVAYPVDVGAWHTGRPGDASLVARCAGPTLDVGCGPGRLAAAVLGQGMPSLGIDLSVAAVRLARRRGAAALCRDVFEPVPGIGRWPHVLLADGNIGIGGDPARLLRRCRGLTPTGGRIHIELAAAGTRTWAGTARLRGPGGASSASFRWASVAVEDLAAVAAQAALSVVATWTEADRWFATLTAD